MAKQVFWCIKDDNNYWFDGCSTFVNRELRAEFRDLKAASEVKKRCQSFRSNLTLVRITGKGKFASSKEDLRFEAGDIWEWVDQGEADNFNQRVGWQIRVDDVSIAAYSKGKIFAHVSFVGGKDTWDVDATEGLKLVERDGKPFTLKG